MRETIQTLLKLKLIKFEFQQTYFWYPQCYGLKDIAAKVHACCEIFSISYLIEHRGNCSMECLANGGDTCCFDECFADRTGIYRNMLFNETALIDSVTKGRSVSPSEISVVEKSITKCSKKITNPILVACNIPVEVYEIVQCVLKENFKNCPKVLENPECQELGKVLQPCVMITTTLPTTLPTTTTKQPTTAIINTSPAPVLTSPAPATVPRNVTSTASNQTTTLGQKTTAKA